MGVKMSKKITQKEWDRAKRQEVLRRSCRSAASRRTRPFCRWSARPSRAVAHCLRGRPPRCRRPGPGRAWASGSGGYYACGRSRRWTSRRSWSPPPASLSSAMLASISRSLGSVVCSVYMRHTFLFHLLLFRSISSFYYCLWGFLFYRTRF